MESIDLVYIYAFLIVISLIGWLFYFSFKQVKYLHKRTYDEVQQKRHLLYHYMHHPTKVKIITEEEKEKILRSRYIRLKDKLRQVEKEKSKK
jgi:low temperature requirement protein LtrA